MLISVFAKLFDMPFLVIESDSKAHSEAIYHSETDGSREKRGADLNRSRGAWCEVWLYHVIFEDGLETINTQSFDDANAWYIEHIDHLLERHQICGSFGTLVWDHVLLIRYPFYHFFKRGNSNET